MKSDKTTDDRQHWITILEGAASGPKRPSDMDEEWEWLMRELGLHPDYFFAVLEAVEEGLSEDELAVFDLLKKENLGKAERERVKLASRDLLIPSNRDSQNSIAFGKRSRPRLMLRFLSSTRFSPAYRPRRSPQRRRRWLLQCLRSCLAAGCHERSNSSFADRDLTFERRAHKLKRR